MARGRPGKVNKDTVLEALKAGKNDTEIAEAQDCQRQYIQYLRRGWEKDGTLPTRVKFQRRIIAVAKPIAELSLDQSIEVMLVAFERASKYPEMETELEKYKRGYAHAMELLHQCEEGDRKKKDQEMRFKVAQQQGEINPPLRR